MLLYTREHHVAATCAVERKEPCSTKQNVRAEVFSRPSDLKITSEKKQLVECEHRADVFALARGRDGN